MASNPRRGSNEPEPVPIIVKKIVTNARHDRHNGQWKVAYADFMTAMMAFFMLMWLLNATDEKTRKGLADYFTPTVNDAKNSAGGNGLLKGDSILADQHLPHRADQRGVAPILLAGAPASEGTTERSLDRSRFQRLKSDLTKRLDRTAELRQFKTHVRFTETPEGLRIDLVDEADLSMFAIGTDQLLPHAVLLVQEVAAVIGAVPNELIIRGHTDARPYAPGQHMNNWRLSSARAEATRTALVESGVVSARIARIEGVADRQPFIARDEYDPRNRRMSIILSWSRAK